MIDSNTKTILLRFGLLLLLVSAALALAYGSVALVGMLILAPLAAFLGPYMGLAYPFPVAFKLAYAGVLCASFTAIVAGLKYRRSNIGRWFAVLGMLGWFAAGVVGLGTGT